MDSRLDDRSMSGRVGGISAIDPSLDARFQYLTALGHRASESGDLTRADSLYREAVDEAEGLLDRAVRQGADRAAVSVVLIAPMARTVAAHNLAGSRNRAGAAEEARAISRRAIDRLIATAGSAATPIALRLNCVRHLRQALLFLSDLDRAQGGSGVIADDLAEQVRTTASDVTRIAKLVRQGADSDSGSVAS